MDGINQRFHLNFWIMVSYLDLFLLIPVGFALWRGWKNGFVMEIFSLLALFVGIYLAVQFSDFMERILREKMDVQSEHLPIISFMIIMLIVGVLLFILGKMITKAVKNGGGGTINNIAGAILSLTKFMLILSIVFIFFNMLDSKYKLLSDHQKSKSYFYEPIYSFSLFVLPSLEESAFYKRITEQELAPIHIDQEQEQAPEDIQ